MDTFELDSDAFYICTEISPRNYVVQKAIQIDKHQIERMIGKLDIQVETGPSFVENHFPGTSSASSDSSTPGFPSVGAPPVLPYWFNRECKTRLMMLGPQAQGSLAPNGLPPQQYIPPAHYAPPNQQNQQNGQNDEEQPELSPEEIKQQVKFQMEYYFSRENLITDKYLKCQMDPEQYVEVAVVASFRKIDALTKDINIVRQAARESAVVEMDENEERVRAITKRTTIIIREIPEDARDEVLKMLADGPEYLDLKYDSNDSWYVTYENELDTQVAYVSVQHKANIFTGRSVCARIKAGGPPCAPPPPPEIRKVENGTGVPQVNGDAGLIHVRDLGQALNDYGFVPVATYRPGDPSMSIYEYVTPTFSYRGNGSQYMNPPQSVTPPQHLEMQQPPPPPVQSFYYNTPTSARNFDELSSASSTSTRTSVSQYRSVSRNGAGYSNQNNYNESRGYSNSGNSQEWRGRMNNGGDQRRFQNNQSNESNGYRPQQNGRGNWRGGYRNNGTNGYNNQNNRQNGQSNWRNEQNGHYRSNENYNNYYQNNNRHGPHASSSSSSTTSSKYFSPEAIETPTNSVPNTPPPPPPPQQSQPVYSVPTPTDLPPPPVWPAPSFDKRRKSSETSAATIVPNSATNTVTPSTPVSPPVFRPDFQQTNGVAKAAEPAPKEHKVEPTPVAAPSRVSEKAQSPPAAPVSPPKASTSSFSFEDEAFPSLPKMPEPEKKPQKPTFR